MKCIHCSVHLACSFMWSGRVNSDPRAGEVIWSIAGVTVCNVQHYAHRALWVYLTCNKCRMCASTVHTQNHMHTFFLRGCNVSAWTYNYTFMEQRKLFHNLTGRPASLTAGRLGTNVCPLCLRCCDLVASLPKLHNASQDRWKNKWPIKGASPGRERRRRHHSGSSSRASRCSRRWENGAWLFVLFRGASLGVQADAQGSSQICTDDITAQIKRRSGRLRSNIWLSRVIPRVSKKQCFGSVFKVFVVDDLDVSQHSTRFLQNGFLHFFFISRRKTKWKTKLARGKSH